jgi:hypothetical protein
MWIMSAIFLLSNIYILYPCWIIFLFCIIHLLCNDFPSTFICKFSLSSFFIVFTFIHMCIHCLGPLSPLSPVPTPCFEAESVLPFVLQFCWRENIKDNKKYIAFLLVWDKDSYKKGFLVLLPCTCITTYIGSSLPHFFTIS